MFAGAQNLNFFFATTIGQFRESHTGPLRGLRVKKYQSLLGALQWLISIGRFDIATAVMTMSKFRVAPRSGHMLRVQRIFAYLSRFREGAIRFRTSLPDLSTLDSPTYNDLVETKLPAEKLINNHNLTIN